MEKFKNLNWRAKILLIFLLMVLIYGTIFYISLPKNQAPLESEKPKSVITPNPSPILFWKTYSSDKYEIAYPSDWKMEEFTHTNGAVTTRIKPSYLSEGEYYPSIDISVENSSSAAILENSYASMPAFRKIGNKYATTSMIKMVGKEKINSPVQEVAVFLNKDNRVYFFEYKYDGDKESREYEELFGRIINSLVSRPTQQQ